MFHITLYAIKDFYHQWDVHFFIMLSLLLQTIQILFAPLRKRVKNSLGLWLILVAHLVADWVSTFAIGLISSIKHPHEILALWAPFVLLHLGGSDTIIAFPLEDNALWLRQFVGLVNQAAVAIIIFTRSLSRDKLGISTILVFVIGTIKYVERTLALYKANRSRFRESMLKEPNPGPDFVKFMEAYTSMKNANLPCQIVWIPESYKGQKTTPVGKLSDYDVVRHAYDFFEIFKGLFANLIFSFHERNKSREFFLNIDEEDAFRVLAVELNFMYEILHTKRVVTYTKLGHFVRFISFFGVLVAFSNFYLIDKHAFLKIDVIITYTLFCGAMGLKTIALFMLAFSDWFIAYVLKISSDNKCIKERFLCLPKLFLTLRRVNWKNAQSMNCFEQVRKFLFHRWSGSLYTYNLINYCLVERQRMDSTFRDHFCDIMIYVMKMMGLKDFYEWMNHVHNKPIDLKLWDFICKELKVKSHCGDDPKIAKAISLARGDWVLQYTNLNHESHALLPYIVDVDYDESVILWHIATDLCWRMEGSDRNEHEQNVDCKKISKVISDYMLYLLVFHPTMMLSVTGISHIRFRDTCAEAKRLFNQKELGLKRTQECEKWASEVILAVNTEVKPVTVKGDGSKSVLFDACILAKELLKIDRDKRWSLLNKVWVELLSYAATQCKANTHAAELSKGGEFITFVWLLMVHLGLSDHFQIFQGKGTAKLHSFD